MNYIKSNTLWIQNLVLPKDKICYGSDFQNK